MDSFLRVEALYAGYGKHAIVHDFSMDALSGKVYALIGPNGAGKTTILRTISGLQKSISGEIRICGRRIEEYTRKELSRVLAVVLTERVQLGMQTAFEVVLLGRLPFIGYFGSADEEDKRIALEALEVVGAAQLAVREFDSLSDGEKQKVLIARALAQQPKIIVLDEPTSHLDMKHKVEIMRILKDLSLHHRVSVVMSLHDVDLAMKMADEVMILKEGKVVYTGMTEYVPLHADITSIYDLSASVYHHPLGAVEIKNENPEKVLVIGGGSAAVPVLRLLAKEKVGAAICGTKPGELDYEVADAMGVRIIDCDAFSEERSEACQELCNAANLSALVVVAGERKLPERLLEEMQGTEKLMHFSASNAGEVQDILRRLS
ncbi:MAG: ABC transporter ATP-binding protein [Bacillota bacterium]|nr:ABC transporter ATP-binding protein [Bacillota bacterium]